MKELIKQLALEQTKLKKSRKTGKYEVARNEWGHPILPKNVIAACTAASKVQLNKSIITAALNLYHELRGSDYRHNFSPNDYEYARAYKQLKSTIPIEDRTS